MNFQYKIIDDAALQPSRTNPRIFGVTLAAIGQYLVRYVRWEPETAYQDHIHQDTEYIYIISGDLSDGDNTFNANTLLTYPSGSGHDNLRTEAGVEMILIRTSMDRANFTDAEGNGAFQVKTLEDNVLLPSSQGLAGISWSELATIADYKIEYVAWKPGAAYPDHTHLDVEYIFIISGGLSDGDRTFHEKTLLTYPPSSKHDNLRTETGAEFILLWTGKDRIQNL